jgi:hypothetical protein
MFSHTRKAIGLMLMLGLMGILSGIHRSPPPASGNPALERVALGPGGSTLTQKDT